ncbi:sensor histidine kinase [Leifsonia sp. A12D58]|uniref:sensor histidine kinase n=1 Tax=Leifsonia sp. A12D58 TaxID=3397674 RepID=UPI0039E1F71B
MHESLTARLARVSLRSKITSVTVLMLTLGLLVSGIGTMTIIKQYVVQQVDQRLVTDAGTRIDSTLQESLKGTSDGMSSDYVLALYDQNGTLLSRTSTDDPPVVSVPMDLASVAERGNKIITLTNSAHDATYHAVSVPFTLNSQGALGSLLIAVSLQPTENTMATYLTIFLGFGLGVVLVGALLTNLLVTTTFAPLREVERTAAAIADGDFSQRLGGATPNTEVGRLNRSLNTMLNRIDRAFKDRARTIDQMRRFVGDASHELRTPLVSVRGYAELYRMGALQTPEEVAQAMERIEKEAIRMGGLVEDLLELARLDEAKPLALAPVDLVPLARDAALDAMASSPGRVVTVTAAPQPEFVSTAEINTISDAAMSDNATTHGQSASAQNGSHTESGTAPAPVQPAPTKSQTSHPLTGPMSFAGTTFARLRTRRPRKNGVEAPIEQPIESAPVEAAPAIVMAEENKIRQVITNLMGNALRFTSVDSPIEIEVGVDPVTQRASLAVIDHGDGIPPQIREKIFQRFWRADTSRARETGGSGLGLAIVASIVATHNGTVEVVETPGGGATFRVWLPLATSPNAPQPIATAPKP